MMFVAKCCTATIAMLYMLVSIGCIESKVIQLRKILSESPSFNDSMIEDILISPQNLTKIPPIDPLNHLLYDDLFDVLTSL